MDFQVTHLPMALMHQLAIQLSTPNGIQQLLITATDKLQLQTLFQPQRSQKEQQQTRLWLMLEQWSKPATHLVVGTRKPMA
jgi:hypothetical protein